jgi:phosphopantetheinyl transferase
LIPWVIARPGPGLDQKRYLCPQEIQEGQHYVHPGRYRQWLLGRAAAKTLLNRHGTQLGLLPTDPALIYIQRTEDGWPRPKTLAGADLPISLSISHTEDRALCAACRIEDGILGTDIEGVEPRPEPFLEDFFTDGERALIHAGPFSQRPALASIIWCIKEAVLKARRCGLKENTKHVDVRALGPLANPGWIRAEVQLQTGGRPEVFFRLLDGGQLALAVARLQTGTP